LLCFLLISRQKQKNTKAAATAALPSPPKSKGTPGVIRGHLNSPHIR